MKNYKTIFGILASAALVALVSSCNLNKLPEFDDNDAFAAFETTTYTVREDVGTLQIPVTVASVAGLTTTVTYAVVDSVSTAVYGTNYRFTDESGVLTFDSEHRTQYITVEITDINDDNFEDYGYDSSYTGNLTFTISLVGSNSVNLGLENTCTVTIRDLNVVFVGLAGTYQCDGYSVQGYSSWTVEMYEDNNNPSIIWIHGLDPYMTDYIDDIYATVADDESSFTIDFPFWCGTYGSYYLCYCLADDEGYYYYYDDITFVKEDDSYVSEDYGFFLMACTGSGDITSAAGYYDWVYSGITLTRIE